MKYYNIHGIVNILAANLDKSQMYEMAAHLREFEVQYLEKDQIDITIGRYSEKPSLKERTVISDYYYYSDNWLDIPEKKLCFNVINSPITVYCEKFMLPVNLLVELVLLRKRYSLIHSAGFSFRGCGYLIPTFGGVGKTTTLAKILENGGKLFGDDLVIIKDNTVLSYPLDFSVYSYHMKILKINNKIVRRKFFKTKLIDYIINSINRMNGYRIIKGIILVLKSFRKSYYPISPKSIFGSDCIENEGSITKVLYLIKKDNNKGNLSICEILPNELAKISTHILMSEWSASLQLLLLYGGLTEFSIVTLYSSIEDTFRNSFKKTKCYEVILPTKMLLSDYIQQLNDKCLN
ncbi:MAG: hypothetical protein A3K31_00715 [Ignavibacteria bacterium RIFOXYA12_FULL_35_25]|nr:MAG: hypothetical protein A2X60_16035 [Ignavibacteria bacterium GWF2_35_20]OGU79380.1 MAG: hypothetical protein A2254_02535 [Ignavibacteria bacterium RIFOXYA2_FULL_35_9]OGU85757.1 MAG: hypothetical protein A3K31_00715 [Ignavibacteria bacterium RIFOXYA12_FULL_35_25]OGV31059.1 MAG: hypothetical protein A2523_05090 [Ignavibacteria bacterium RIFOXYD12_FULL_36_8]